MRLEYEASSEPLHISADTERAGFTMRGADLGVVLGEEEGRAAVETLRSGAFLPLQKERKFYRGNSPIRKHPPS